MPIELPMGKHKQTAPNDGVSDENFQGDIQHRNTGFLKAQVLSL